MFNKLFKLHKPQTNSFPSRNPEPLVISCLSIYGNFIFPVVWAKNLGILLVPLFFSYPTSSLLENRISSIFKRCPKFHHFSPLYAILPGLLASTIHLRVFSPHNSKILLKPKSEHVIFSLLSFKIEYQVLTMPKCPTQSGLSLLFNVMSWLTLVPLFTQFHIASVLVLSHPKHNLVSRPLYLLSPLPGISSSPFR